MPRTRPQSIDAKAIGPLAYALAALYLWLWVDASLLYDANPWFPDMTSWAGFLADGVAEPGGPVIHAIAALAQHFHQPITAALIVAALAVLASASLGVYAASISREQARWVRFVPLLLIVAVQNRYGFHLAGILALALATLGAAAYTRLSSQASSLRILIFLGIGLPVYYLAGGAFAVYALMCAIHEFRTNTGRALGLVFLISTALIPWVVGTLLLDLHASRAFLRLLPVRVTFAGLLGLDFRGGHLMALLYASYPITALAMAISAGRRSSPRPESTEPLLRPGLKIALIAAVVAAAVVPTFDAAQKSRLQLQRDVRRGDFESAVTHARSLAISEYTIGALHNLNYALQRSGRLPDEMFSFPQSPDGLMAGIPMGTGVPAVIQTARRSLFFELAEVSLWLGMVNESEHEAIEAWTTYGQHACTLKRLARTSLARGQTQAARTFLQALTHAPAERRWARETLAELDRDETLRADRYIAHLRSVMPTEDRLHRAVRREDRLRELLERNPRNRLAFEYLMAGFMLERRLDEFAGRIPQLAELGYERIPVHFQEAIVLHEGDTKASVDTGGLAIDLDTRMRFERFARFTSDPAALQDAQSLQALLREEFGNSYFYYYVFSLSGVGGR